MKYFESTLPRTHNNRTLHDDATLLTSAILPPFKFFLCRLCRQQAISRILISTNPVPDEIPINIKRPRDVFIKGLPVVSVCCVVRTDMDGCGATDLCVFSIIWVIFKGRLSEGWWRSFEVGLRGWEVVSHIKGERFMGTNFHCVMDQRTTTEFSVRLIKKKFLRH